jgi:hypothetical protein
MLECEGLPIRGQDDGGDRIIDVVEAAVVRMAGEGEVAFAVEDDMRRALKWPMPLSHRPPAEMGSASPGVPAGSMMPKR